LEVDVMSEAVAVIRDMQQDMKLRHLALQRDIAERDEVQALGEAERRGIELGERRGERRIICQMYANGLDIPTIARATGHSESQVAALLEKT
jgi:predicted transposase/invertase (TIGR01784 family)